MSVSQAVSTVVLRVLYVCARPRVAEPRALAWCSHVAPLSSTEVRWCDRYWPSATLDPGLYVVMSPCAVVSCVSRRAVPATACLGELLFPRAARACWSSPVQALLFVTGASWSRKKGLSCSHTAFSEWEHRCCLLVGTSCTPGVVLEGGAQPDNKCCSRCVHCQSMRTVAQLFERARPVLAVARHCMQGTRAPLTRAAGLCGLPKEGSQSPTCESAVAQALLPVVGYPRG
jgi:hypothetical protein